MHFKRIKAVFRSLAGDTVVLSFAIGILFARCAQSQSDTFEITHFLGLQPSHEYVYLGELGRRIETVAIERLGPNSFRVQESVSVVIEGEPYRSTGTYILSADHGEITRRVAEQEEILLKEPLTLAGARWSTRLAGQEISVDTSSPLLLECEISSIGRSIVLGEDRATLTVECVGDFDSAQVPAEEYRYGRPKVVVIRWFAESFGLIREELMFQDDSGLNVTTERLLHEVRESTQQSYTSELQAGDVEAAVFETVMAGDTARLRQLIEAGADVNARNSVGHTPLMVAVARNRVDMLEELLAAGADLNATTPEGATPLIVATIQQNAEAVTFLVAAGADLTHRIDTELYPGKTALEIARENGNQEIEATLRRSHE